MFEVLNIFETQSEALEEFWESETPRVGEANANDYSGWVSSGRPEAIPTNESCTQTNADVIPLVHSFSSWYTDKTRADRLFRTPARSTSERAASGPYATVLFSDIRPLLLPHTTQQAKIYIRICMVGSPHSRVLSFSR